jgi:hypothetical protein
MSAPVTAETRATIGIATNNPTIPAMAAPAVSATRAAAGWIFTVFP